MVFKRARKFFRRHGWLGSAASWLVHGYNLYFFVSLPVAAMIAWASTTWTWYWSTFNWAGAAIAFLGGLAAMAVIAILFSVAASIYARRDRPIPDALSTADIEWWSAVIMTGGPLSRRPVHSLTFKGMNKSRKETELRSAYLTSAINGERVDLFIVAEGKTGNEVVRLDEVNLIPPSAHVEMVARFNHPDGIESSEFLRRWSRFYFNATDSGGSVRHEQNEQSLAVFFPGKLGPRVTVKANS